MYEGLYMKRKSSIHQAHTYLPAEAHDFLGLVGRTAHRLLLR
jgi:hypothetical protein